jgi:endonuclease/exonuclease/phosphatase family metal-dependent hydrolase
VWVGIVTLTVLAQPNDGVGVLAARRPNQIRTLTWNVGGDAVIGPAARAGSIVGGSAGQFARVLRAVRPDVLCLQDVPREPEQLVRWVAALLPTGPDEQWHVHAVLDNVIVSRFPLRLPSGRIFTQGALRRGHVAALIDLPDQMAARDVYVICAHFQSRIGFDQLLLRQRQADAIAAWIGDAHAPGGEITLPQGTPIVVMGDLNVIDQPSPSLNTLLTGDIVDERTFGGDIRPDWDGSSLADILPLHNEAGIDTYTWRDDTQQYPPGTLDRVLYSDSVLAVTRAFVLDTTRLSEDELQRAGLHATDVMRDPAHGIYDHLPIVADFRVLDPAGAPSQPAR